MGAITVGPELRFPKMCAGRGAVKVTIASARATAPVCSPMTSTSAPEGISTAITGALAEFILAIASAYAPLTGGRNPLPRIASIRTSQANTACADFGSPHPLKTAKGGGADFVVSSATLLRHHRAVLPDRPTAAIGLPSRLHAICARRRNRL